VTRLSVYLHPGRGATTTPYNPYRYNAMRWDSATGQYDMGFRTYDSSLNQFLTRDMYNGALADMALDTDPFTGNRYSGLCAGAAKNRNSVDI
jgi:RHS repeat-associated protein